MGVSFPASSPAASLTLLGGCLALGLGLSACDGPPSTAPRTVTGTPAPAAAVAELTPPPPEPTSPPEPQPSYPPEFIEAATKLAKLNEGRTRAWKLLAEMVDLHGPRLSGSQALEDAIDWAAAQMEKDGLVEVRKEEVMVPHWVRGRESARMVGPVERELTMVGLGGSVGTPRRGIKAPVVVVESLEELERRASELKGKIVLINQRMPPYDTVNHDAGYGVTVKIRGGGPSAAARHGAKAVLIRSVTAHSLDTPHTGALNYAEGIDKIPAAALSPGDAEFVARMVGRGEATVELKMEAKTLPDAKSHNLLAELRGREKPEEVVLIGGHIDSWDVGDGATDDGSGCLMAMEAAAMLKELDLIPRRTIRVVLFTNEENGLRGGKHYAAEHGNETHVAAIESDAGSGAPWGFSAVGSDEAVKTMQSWLPLFESMGIEHLDHGWGGADISPLTSQGVLSLAVRPDGSHYFDLHHSPADTVEKIVPADLQRNAAAMALLAYMLAENPEALAGPEPTADKGEH